MNDTIFYKTSEVAEILKTSKSGVNRMAKRLSIKPLKGSMGLYHRFTPHDIELMRNFENRIVTSKEIIYVTRTWEIYESKMNYLTE